MALPKLSYPLFEVVVPSTGKKTKLRPFLVREEKILLLAQTSDDPSDTIKSIHQVIQSCMVNPKDSENLTTFDLEYLFVKLRSKSVSNIIEILYTDPEDQQQYKVNINLDNVEIKKEETHTTKIEFAPNFGVIMKYPSLDIGEKLKKVDTEVDLFFQLIALCLDKIYDEENVYNVYEYSVEEVEEFVSSLDVNAFKKVQHFFETTPKIYYETTYITKEGVEKKLVLENLNDFFSLG